MGLYVIAGVDLLYALDEDTDNYWTRLNYGFAAVKERRVCVVEDYWSHTFHLTLPTEPRQSVNGLSRRGPTILPCDSQCEKLKELPKATK